MHCYGDQPRKDNADGDGHAILIGHRNVAISVSDNWRRRHSNAVWYCGAGRRRLYLRGDNINGWQRNNQHSRRIAGDWNRYTDDQLHARLIEFLDLQRRIGDNVGDSKHPRHGGRTAVEFPAWQPANVGQRLRPPRWCCGGRERERFRRRSRQQCGEGDYWRLVVTSQSRR